MKLKEALIVKLEARDKELSFNKMNLDDFDPENI